MGCLALRHHLDLPSLPRKATQDRVVSVIIPTFNNIRTIGLCLESIRQQTWKRLEIILVDNFSTDETRSIARKSGATVHQVRLERSAARNFGVNASSGEYIFIVDSDFELSRGLIEDCVRTCEAGCDCVRVHELFVGLNYWSRCRALEQRTYWGDEVIEAPRFMLRRAYDSVGGFDESLVAGEDYDLGQRLVTNNFRTCSSNFMILHHEPGDLRTIVMKKHYYGKTMGAYMQKYGNATFRHFALVRLGWIKQRTILLSDPAHACGMLLIKWLQYNASFIGFAQERVGRIFSRRH